jgi:GxxExxY protein
LLDGGTARDRVWTRADCLEISPQRHGEHRGQMSTPFLMDLNLITDTVIGRQIHHRDTESTEAGFKKDGIITLKQDRDSLEISPQRHGEHRGRMSTPFLMDLNLVTDTVIGAGIEVHRRLGPGLLESAYQQCLAQELSLRGVAFEREKELPVIYKGVGLDCGYRLDFLVDGALVVEIKAVDALAPIHAAQMLTYLKLGGWELGLLLNFNVTVLKDGIRRMRRFTTETQRAQRPEAEQNKANQPGRFGITKL